MTNDVPALRLARNDEADEIDALMKASIRDIFPRFYGAAQTDASVQYVGSVDRQLIADGTYYVADAEDEVVACGGWSRRANWTRRGLGRRILEACEAAAKAEGFRMLSLLGTLPGLPLYEIFGFVETGRSDVVMPNRVRIECASMEKPVAV